MDKSAAAKPVLNKLWWDKNKAKTLTSTGVGKSLLTFQMALDKALRPDARPVEDEKAVQKAIGETVKTMVAARGKANKTLHAETITALLEMEKMLFAEQKRSVERSQKTPPAPKQDDSGRPDVLFSIKVADEVRKKYNPRWITQLSGYELTLTLNPSISRALSTDRAGLMLAQQMQEAAKKIADNSVDAIAGYIKKIDDGSARAGAKDVEKARNMLAPFIDKELEKAKQQIGTIPKQAWAKFVARQQQYKDYKVDSAVTVAKGALGVAGSAAGIVGSGGAGLAIGIVTLVRSSAALVKVIYDLAIDANRVGNELAKDVDTLRKQYYDAAGQLREDQRNAGEITGSLLKAALGTPPPFFATIPKALDNYELWDNKIAGVITNGGALTGDVTTALQKCAELERKIKNAEERTSLKIYEDLLKMRESLDNSLTKVSDLMAKAQKFDAEGPILKKLLDDMDDDRTVLLKVVDAVAPAVVNLGLSGAGAGLDFKSAESALEYYKTAQGLANDIADVGTENLKAALGD